MKRGDLLFLNNSLWQIDLIVDRQSVRLILLRNGHLRIFPLAELADRALTLKHNHRSSTLALSLEQIRLLEAQLCAYQQEH
jgi:hypothetical protein